MHNQNRLLIFAACEDPRTIATDAMWCSDWYRAAVSGFFVSSRPIGKSQPPIFGGHRVTSLKRHPGEIGLERVEAFESGIHANKMGPLMGDECAQCVIVRDRLEDMLFGGIDHG